MDLSLPSHLSGEYLGCVRTKGNQMSMLSWRGDLLMRFPVAVLVALVLVSRVTAASAPHLSDIIFQSPNDLWDVSRGTIITASSGAHSSSDLTKMFGIARGGEATRAVFADGRPRGSVHFVEWKTTNIVTIRSIRLMAAHDPASWGPYRVFGAFRLFATDTATGTQELLCSFQAGFPYVSTGEPVAFEVSDLPSVTASSFRAEFDQAGTGGPRIIELDGFDTVAPPSTWPTVTITPDGGSFAPAVNVSLSCSSPSVSIRYTSDGKIPNYSSALYTSPFLVSRSSTISARAIVDDFPVSETRQANFVYSPEPIRFTNQPASITVLQGQTASFSAEFIGSQPVSLQWHKGESPLSDDGRFRGSKSSVLTIISTDPADAGDYWLRASNSLGNTSSAFAHLTVLALPAVLSAPIPFQIVPEQGNLQFVLTVAGEPPIACQWRFNGVDIPGATDLTLSLTNVTASQSGTYSAHLSNVAGTTDTDPYVVNVDSGVGGAVLLSNNSAAPVLDVDGVSPLSGPGFLAQLYAGLPGSALHPVGAAVPFLPTSTGQFFGGTRHIAEVTPGDLAQVQVRVWESGRGTTYESAVANGSRMGASVAFTVPTGGSGEPPSPAAPLAGLASFSLSHNPAPQFAVSPGNVTTILGAQVTLSATVTGEAPFSYQWRFKDVPVPGATGASLVIPSTQASDAGDYRLEVWNAIGTNLSAPAMLLVRAGLALNVSEGGRVRTTPEGASFEIGSSVQLEAVPNELYLFAGWTGDLTGTQTQATLTMETNRQVSARFVHGWGLWVQAGPGGSVSVSPNQQVFPEGAQAVITATPSEGFAFERWTGDLVGFTNPATLPMTFDVVAAAEFRDAKPPTIAILTPISGTTDDERVTFSGTVTDNLGVASVRWERNGADMGNLPLADGSFSITGLKLAVGENRFKVVAADAAGNTAFAEVVATWTPSRRLLIGNGGERQEGLRVEIPIQLTSLGDVAGMSWVLRYDAAVLADPQWTWNAGLDSAIKAVNTSTPGEVRATFSLPATSLAAGDQTLASVSFRARSVPASTTTQVLPELLDASNPQGDRILAGSIAQPGSATILPRDIKGDNNGNDRLDVGDASLIQRLVTGLDQARAWDISGNDLNATGDLDSGDVIRVLRVVVGLDAPPPPPPAGGDKSKLRSLKPGFLKDGPSSSLANIIRLGPDELRGSAAQRVTVQVRLQDPGFAISGASFSLLYPTNALRLINTDSHKAGSVVPSGSLVMWNVFPSQNNFVTQSGKVTFAAVSATPWTASAGVLAELTFEIQPGAEANYRWPLQLVAAEITRNGYENFALADTGSNLIGRDPRPAQIGTVSVPTGNSGLEFRLTGETGLQYRIDSSTDLRTWAPLGTVTCTDGQATFRDTESASHGWRFYRAVMLP